MLPTMTYVTELPLDSVAYLHDDTLEGLLSAVFLSYARHENPEDIVAQKRYQPRLGQSAIHVETNFQHAERVRKGVVKAAGNDAFMVIARASTCDNYEMGSYVLAFVRFVIDYSERFGKRPSLYDVSNPAIENIMRLDRSVRNESERIRQFARFSHLDNGVWFARINPSASIVPFVMSYFESRLNGLPFIVYDERHGCAGVHDGRSWMLVRDDAVNVPPSTENDKIMQEAWKVFYDALSVEARYNPELRRSFMPVRLWRNLTEMTPRRQL